MLYGHSSTFCRSKRCNASTYQTLGGQPIPGAEDWGESSFSAVHVGDYVIGRVALLDGQSLGVQIADSKELSGNPPDEGRALRFPPGVWQAFIGQCIARHA